MILSYNLSTFPVINHFGFVSYKEPWMHFKRLTNEYLLYFIKNGELNIEESGIRYTLKKGSMLLLRPNIMHCGFKKACCDYYYVHFSHSGVSIIDKTSEEIAEEINTIRSEPLKNIFFTVDYKQYSNCYIPNHYNVSNEKSLAYILYMLKDALEHYNNKNECYKNLASCKLTELVIRISREYLDTNLDIIKTKYPKGFVKCQALLDFLNHEYHQKITSCIIENKFESNYSYLNRVFHKLTGHTIINYLNIVRINKSIELMKATSISFSEIAYLVGINDPYYFSKLFKKIKGQSPTQYYKTHCQ